MPATMLAGLAGSMLVDGPSWFTVGQLARHQVLMPRKEDDTLEVLISKLDKSNQRLNVAFEEVDEERSEAIKNLDRLVRR